MDFTFILPPPLPFRIKYSYRVNHNAYTNPSNKPEIKLNVNKTGLEKRKIQRNFKLQNHFWMVEIAIDRAKI